MVTVLHFDFVWVSPRDVAPLGRYKYRCKSVWKRYYFDFEFTRYFTALAEIQCLQDHKVLLFHQEQFSTNDRQNGYFNYQSIQVKKAWRLPLSAWLTEQAVTEDYDWYLHHAKKGCVLTMQNGYVLTMQNGNVLTMQKDAVPEFGLFWSHCISPRDVASHGR